MSEAWTCVFGVGDVFNGPEFSKLNTIDSHRVYVYRPWAMLDGAASRTI
ncbi:hypothetical protein [Colwellia hornerae]|nr:hypothetical protein [Colwellia hornerae]